MRDLATVPSSQSLLSSSGQTLDRDPFGINRASLAETPLAESSLTDDEKTGLWPMYEELARNGRWPDRLSALGSSDSEFWATLIAATADPSIETSWSAMPAAPVHVLFEFIRVSAGAALEPAEYVRGLPSLPRGIEAFVVATFWQSLEARGVPDSLVDAEVLRRDLLFPLLRRLQFFLAPCLAVDMNARSMRGELGGDTPEARFTSYNVLLASRPEIVRAVFDEFSALGRRVARIVQTRCDAMAAMLRRLRDDREDVAASIGIRPSAVTRVAGIEGPLGDPHANGQGVFSIAFADGTRVMYKPRDFGLDVAFQHLLAWFNERSPRYAHGALRVLDRGTHGWMEYVHYAPCNDVDEVARFYWRQGSFLALLYVLGGRDFYYENVRARGEIPYLVDVECLVTPAMPQVNAVLVSTEGRRYMLESVLAAGLLPDFTWAGEDEAGISLSSLGVVDGQALPMAIPQWEGLGSDDLRLVFKRDVVRSPDLHLPRLNGQPISLTPHLRDVVQGFRETYDCLRRHRAELLGEDGPLVAFRGKHNRVVIRQTRDYQRLLQEAAHPDHLRDAVDLARFFERLFSSLSPRYAAGVVQSEIEQLGRVDIPYFATRTDSLSLWDGYGRLVSKDYFAESATAGMLRRLERLSDVDRERQVRIIERSTFLFEKPQVDTDDPMVEVGTRERLEGTSGAGESPLLREALSVADRILHMSIGDEESLTWIDLAIDYAGNVTQSSLDLGVYEGAEGIGLMLLYLGQATGERRLTEAAERIIHGTSLPSLRTIWNRRHDAAGWVRVFPGPMTFPASSLYYLMHAEACLGQTLVPEELLDSAVAWFEQGLTCKPRYDFLSGAAGIIHVLLLAHERYGAPRCLAAARKFGAFLADTAVARPAGVAWHGSLFGQYVAGYSHGVSGIAPALFALASRTSDERLRATAIGALRYDQSLYRADIGDWLDQRVPDQERPCPFPAWCHGAAGILLGRIQCRSYAPELRSVIDADIDQAVQLLRRGDTDSDCLCHGEMGNADILLSAGLSLERPDIVDAAYRRLNGIWDASRRRGVWRCGLTAKNVAVPGLFLGLAGIAYTLLRFARPHAVPSLMSLAGPVTTRPKGAL